MDEEYRKRVDLLSLSPGDIVQIGPAHHWPGCLVVVEEVKVWGVLAYLQLPADRTADVVAVIPENRAYIRLSFGDFARAGGRVP